MANNLKRAVPRPIQTFLSTEASGGLMMLLAAVLALVLANTPARDLYHDLLTWELPFKFAEMETFETLVNDGLMTIFFFVVGLEIKRELVEGELRDPRTAALPIIAALGGMIVPALLFLSLNAGEVTQRGWGIPIATDIAFTIGLVIVLGSRIPSGIKIFLLTLAIADDIGGIAVIAVFYTEGLSMTWLAAAVVGLVTVYVMRRAGVSSILPYLVVGVGVWAAMLESGVHATISGVALGLMTPVAPVAGRRILHTLEDGLHPWSSYVVIPIFALTNAGIEVSGEALSNAFTSSLTWGVVLGLVVGKTVGVSVFTLVANRFHIGRLPAGVGRRHVIGIGALAGVGFTVALFIANLSFRGEPGLLEDAKMGVLTASLVAALLGSGWLVFFTPRPVEPAMAAEPG